MGSFDFLKKIMYTKTKAERNEIIDLNSHRIFLLLPVGKNLKANKKINTYQKTSNNLTWQGI
jgi:hypothetical protein